MQPEQWKPVVGYEGLYEVSSNGRVRSLSRTRTRPHPRNPECTLTMRYNGRILKPQSMTSGYHFVTLSYGKSKQRHHAVHRLVLEAHVEQTAACGPKVCCNHKNGIKTDNRLSNLEWVSYSENNKHAFATGLKQRQRGILSPRAILDEMQVRTIRQMARRGASYPQLARAYCVGKTTIEHVVRRKTWQHVED